MNDKINIKNDEFTCTLSSESLNKLSASGFLRRLKISYKLLIKNRELKLVCPTLKNSGRENVVLWPAIKLPFRKYPVYVYLYAAALYLSSDMSMRDVAACVRQKFGLDKFSHSTVSRTLKKLSEITEELLNIMNTDPPPDTIPKVINRSRWSNEQQTNYKRLLSVLFPVLDKVQTVTYSSLLNYTYFNNQLKFVI